MVLSEFGEGRERPARGMWPAGRGCGLIRLP